MRQGLPDFLLLVDKATLDIQWTGNTKENMVWLAKFRKTAQA